jgi:hypothetical protein
LVLVVASTFVDQIDLGKSVFNKKTPQPLFINDECQARHLYLASEASAKWIQFGFKAKEGILVLCSCANKSGHEHGLQAARAEKLVGVVD